MTIAYNTPDIVAAIMSMQIDSIETVVAELQKKFPDCDNHQLGRAIEIAADEKRQQALEYTGSADALALSKTLLDGLPAGTTLGEAVRIKAKQGNPLALEFMRQLNSAEHRRDTELVNAAVDRHPDWERTDHGFRWVGKGEPPLSLDTSSLIDWLQTNHPQVAREIEKAFER